jgi:uncharacterized membrane protein YadS
MKHFLLLFFTSFVFSQRKEKGAKKRKQVFFVFALHFLCVSLLPSSEQVVKTCSKENAKKQRREAEIEDFKF